jgi:GMP synthase (glutamine-hydrolysing)
MTSIDAAEKPLLIVQTGSAAPEVLARYGDFPEWFRRGLGLNPRRMLTVRADVGERLPAPGTVAGAVITGSAVMVPERLDWSERTAAWLRTAVAADLPLLGVCYGHQLLAHALGGTVDYNPRGREIGTAQIECLPAAADDALLGGMPLTFLAHATHLQTVLSPPPGAVVLARSDLDACQVARFAPRAWGVQFHPEFGMREMRGYLHARSEAIDYEGLDVAALLRGVRSCPDARRVLRRFAQLSLRAPQKQKRPLGPSLSMRPQPVATGAN